MVARRSGIALVEALVSLAIFVVLVGSVAYASRIALSVMTESMNETKLLYRVRRALDHAEEQLSRCSRISIVTPTQDDWTLVGLENWFEQQALDFDGSPHGDAAADVLDQLKQSRRSMQEGPPDYPTAGSRITDAIDAFDSMVIGGFISAGDAVRLRDALEQVQSDIMAHSIVSLGGLGTGIPFGWIDIQQMIATMDPLLPAEPLVEADEVLFRQVVLGADGPEYRPPLDQPPCSYFLRPMDSGDEYELAYYDGIRTIVIANHLTGLEFERDGDILKITFFFEEEVDGAVITRTEVRSVVLRVP